MTCYPQMVRYDQRATQYDEWYRRLGQYDDARMNERWRHELASLPEAVWAFAGGRLLEVASGTGWWTSHLARGAKVTALDCAPLMLAMLGERLEREGVGADRVRADAYHLPFASESFDRAFFGFWLSHVGAADLPAFFGELRRVVRRGGRGMMIDSHPYLAEHQPGVEGWQTRRLNDGSTHQVLKVYHTPSTLQAWLAPHVREVRIWATETFFVLAEFAL